MNKSIELPSGAKVAMTLADFESGLALYEAVTEEGYEIRIDVGMEVLELYKNVFCRASFSKKIKAALWKCFERVTYNGEKITKDTFEKVEARQDYLKLCMEVGKFNLDPFTKDLYAQYAPLLEKLRAGPA